LVQKKSEKKTRLVALVGLLLVIGIGLVVVYVPVQSQEVQCITAPCPPIEKTIYDLIIESDSFNGSSIPEDTPVCIDGIYFGVCTGDQHFDSGQACFGLTTQQCFDQCNVVGTTCRLG